MTKRQEQIKTKDYCFYNLLLDVNEDKKTSQFSGKFYYKTNDYDPEIILDLLNEKLPDNWTRTIEISFGHYELIDELFRKVYDFTVNEDFE